MKMRTFLAVCAEYNQKKKPVIIFTAKEYPVIFFARLIECLRLKYALFFKSLSLSDISFLDAQVQLTTTFLGSTDFLWCGSLSLLDNTTKKKYIALLSCYTGPHVVWAFITEKDFKECSEKQFDTSVVVNLDEPLSATERDNLFSLLFDTLSWSALYELTKESYKTMTLDTLVMLGQYRLVLGKNTHRFSQEWLGELIAPQESMFTLAQYFFARKSSHFFRMWKILYAQRDPLFWVAFWSEQLWRAYYVVTYIKKNQLVQAKQIAFRLPFSFLQRDWKQNSEKQMRDAHALLYEGDFRLKNGGSDLFFDLFFTRYFESL